MEPVTGAVVAIVLFGFSIPVFGFMLIVGLSSLGFAVDETFDTFWAAPVGIILGWLLAFGWAAFAIIHIVLQTIHLIELLA